MVARRVHCGIHVYTLQLTVTIDILGKVQKYLACETGTTVVEAGNPGCIGRPFRAEPGQNRVLSPRLQAISTLTYTTYPRRYLRVSHSTLSGNATLS